MIPLIIVFLAAAAFRLYQFPNRIIWDVEQSMLFWELKKIVVDHKLSLIGNHFFSLVNGPVYRTSFVNWFLSIPMFLFGLRVEVLFLVFTGISLVSLLLVAKTAEKISGKRARLISALIYALSAFIAFKETEIWYAALMISLSAFFAAGAGYLAAKLPKFVFLLLLTLSILSSYRFTAALLDSNYMRDGYLAGKLINNHVSPVEKALITDTEIYNNSDWTAIFYGDRKMMIATESASKGAMIG